MNIKIAIILMFIVCYLISLIVYNCNKKEKIAIIFELDDRAGFFSVFFQLCNLYIYAKENSYDFYITHNNWLYTSSIGWHDYFTSLTMWNENYADMYEKIKKYNVTGDCFPKYSISKYINAIKEIFKVKKYLHERAQSIINNLGDYNAIYIRRGDKSSEMEILPIDKILHYTDLKQDNTTLFVQTDDYSIINDIKKHIPNCNVKTTCLNHNNGSTAEQIKNWTKKQRKHETEKLIIEMLVFANAKRAWSDYRSNVGRFHKLNSYNTTFLYPPDNLKSSLETPIIPSHCW